MATSRWTIARGRGWQKVRPLAGGGRGWSNRLKSVHRSGPRVAYLKSKTTGMDETSGRSDLWEVRLFQLELHLVCGKADLATDRAERPEVPEIKPLKRGGEVGRVHLGRRCGRSSSSRSSMRSDEFTSVIGRAAR